MKTEKEQEIIKKIAYHEAYSTAYKMQLAGKLVTRGVKAIGTAVSSGTGMVKNHMKEKRHKKVKKMIENAKDKKDKKDKKHK